MMDPSKGAVRMCPFKACVGICRVSGQWRIKWKEHGQLNRNWLFKRGLLLAETVVLGALYTSIRYLKTTSKMTLQLFRLLLYS